MRPAALFAVYVALAAMRVWPLLAEWRQRAPDEADGLMVAWTLWAAGSRLASGYPAMFGANAFHPHPGALLYADAMLAPGAVAAPLVALLGDALPAANVMLVLTLALSALGVHCLARALTGSHLAAAVAAAAMAFGSFAMANQARMQILGVQWIALALLALYLWFHEGRRRHAWAFAGCVVLTGLSCLYYLTFLAIAVAVLAPAFAASSPRRLGQLPWLAAFVPGCLASALLGLLAGPYLRLHSLYGFDAGTPRRFDLVLYFTPPQGSYAYPAVAEALRLPGFSLTYFVGYVVIGLAVVGVVSVARAGRRGPGAATWIGVIALAAVATLLSAGPDVIWRGQRIAPGPYRLLEDLPPFSSMREPRRLAVLVLLSTALLAARGAAALLARSPARLRPAIAVALAAVVTFEHAAAGDARGVEVPAGPRLPQAYRWLAARGGREPVAELPARPLRLNRRGALEQYFATVHGRPILSGWPSFAPPALELILWELRDFPDARSLALLRALGVRYAIVHPRRWESERARFVRRIEERADVLPVVARFDEPDDAVHERFQLGGEMVLEILGVPPPVGSECRCVPVPSSSLRADASPGPRDAALAIDGDRRTRWTTGRLDQRPGMHFDLRLNRPRRLARVEVAAAFPYGEFGRHVEVHGLTGGEWRRIGPRPDHSAMLATVRDLVVSPSKAWLVYPTNPLPVEAVRLMIARHPEDGTGPWSLPEVRLLEAVGE